MALISFEDAKSRLLTLARPVADTEVLDLADAMGRTLATDLASPMDVPPFTNSAMDGYALRACDVPAVGTRLKVSLRIAAGQAGGTLASGTTARIFTGAPLPDGADTVVMQEDCLTEGDEVLIQRIPKAGQHVRTRAGELRVGQAILSSGTRLTPACLGLAASVGIGRVEVKRRLRVAIFFTGSELRVPGETLAPGQIYNSNRYVMRGFLQQMGAEILDLGIIPDDREATREAIRRAAGADVILTSGGMSVGEEDYVTSVVKEEGRLDVWKIAIKPGKPLAFGTVGEAAFVGLPGNPVAVWVGLLTMVAPFLRRCQGMTTADTPTRPMRADFAYTVKGDRPEFVRVRRNGNGGLDIFRTQDSSAISSAAWADGLVLIAAGATISPGDSVGYLAIPD
ncbi:MAG: molybdopterin molybdotransferase MoeA [Rhodocyclaceae bacterium]|nr:molybdopterin molybdotransferase MoeA [Rhodocyclaceae bacterium]